MSAPVALEVSGVTKTFGSKLALDRVELSVPEGSVFGFLGPNGAGKTTLLRILAGLSRKDAGTVALFGEDPTAVRMRGDLSYLPDVPGFYPWMKARDVMGLAARLSGVEPTEATERIEALLRMAGLEDEASLVGGYSRGMKQRLGMAQALVGAPRFLMLDEPTSALDPLGRRELLDMVASLRGRTTILFSTHILADVERVCDHIAIIDRGRTVKQGTVEEFRHAFPTRSLELQLASDATTLGERIAAQSWCEQVVFAGSGRLRVLVNDIDRARYEIPGLIAQSGSALLSFSGGEVGLEDVFVKLVGGEDR